MLRFSRITILWLSFVGFAHAQFSPGELSRAHQELEGSQNCVKCHEVGRTILGSKCLACHTEIGKQIESKHGYHFSVNDQICVTCHKEHIGRDAKTVVFEQQSFDHAKTGFTLIGAHKTLECKRCHTSANVKDSTMRRILSDHPHTSFLGLKEDCASCHTDAHRGSFQQSCTDCHNTIAWKEVAKFDHAKTKFPLAGRHIQVRCEQCHAAIHTSGPGGQVNFATKEYADCEPCHTTPHGSKFSGTACSSCHTSENWKAVAGKAFDHSLTSFVLKGKHAPLRCEQCHTKKVNGNAVQVMHPLYARCTDCHTDKHHGEFVAKYSNDCKLCHTEEGFSPSSFTLSSHTSSRFPLTGAHVATLCSQCHKSKGGKTESVFHFANLRCETCHEDPHKGSFAKMMSDSGCVRCHSTLEWKSVSFDHSGTNFALSGKHIQTKCMDCHKQSSPALNPLQFAKLEKRCETCHKDIHAGQFAVSENTECNTCHQEKGWKYLIFDHETQSSFSLKGGHSKLECGACHREERSQPMNFIRFKPLSKQCESCHQQRIK